MPLRWHLLGARSKFRLNVLSVEGLHCTVPQPTHQVMLEGIAGGLCEVWLGRVTLRGGSGAEVDSEMMPMFLQGTLRHLQHVKTSAHDRKLAGMV